MNNSALTSLKLTENKLTGVVPMSFTALTGINTLELDNNQLAGSLYGYEFPYIKKFSISSNYFTGTIPTSILRSDHLTVYDIADNCFSPSIPSTLCSCSKLEFIIMDGMGTK